MNRSLAVARLVLGILCGSLLPLASPAQPASPRHTFRIANGAFLLDGKPIQLISGELHYARIPAAYWRHRLRMAKAMGLNTVATYVFWNYHEAQPGHFDFRSGNHDLARFIRVAQEEGLWVILRPGPYVCAEWDFGGLPSWLLRDATMRVRSGDPRFLRAERRYVRAVAEQVRPLLVTHGGPILMVQAENEYGSFGADSAYKEATRRLFVDAGIDVPLFTADGDWLFEKGGIPGVFAAANGEANFDSLARRSDAFNGGHGPYMVAEFYPGWLMHWAEPFPATPIDSFLPAYEALLARGASVNLYMFHGGTNFGFTAGANYSKAFPIQPSETSYDYDAPLSEPGWATPKYYALRRAIARHLGHDLPPVPERLPVITLPAVRLGPVADLYDLVANVRPIRAVAPLSFAALGQPSGYVLYRHQFASAVDGRLELPGLRDHAAVFVDGRRVATLDRRSGTLAADVAVPRGGRLDIFVAAWGRINYGARLVDDRKGIVEPGTIGGRRIDGWSMYPLPFIRPAAGAHVRRRGVTDVAGVPTVYRGEFLLRSTGDTFLDLRGWHRGIVFVNGVNLGRYWSVGPQQTLYLPGAWLHRGRNVIEVFDLDGAVTPAVVAGLAAPILTTPPLPRPSLDPIPPHNP